MITWLRKILGLRWWCGEKLTLGRYEFWCTARPRGHFGEHVADDPDEVELVRWDDDGGYRWMG